MMKMRANLLLAAVIVALSLQPAQPAVAQIAEAQRMLNGLNLDAGPADGEAGKRTLEAWKIFLRYRGLPESTPLDAVGIAELRGQTDIEYPKADGFKFRLPGDRFPSKDSYRRDPDDPATFSITLKEGDYDTASYEGSTDVIEQNPEFNFRKQRAELKSQGLSSDVAHTVDFEVKLSNLNTGSFFQIHRGRKSGFLLGTIGTGFLVNAGEVVLNVVIAEPNLFDTWHAFRIMFYPASDGYSWFKVYLDGELKLDTSNQNARLPYPNTFASVHFGLYRGVTATETTAYFRNLRLLKGDTGHP